MFKNRQLLSYLLLFIALPHITIWTSDTPPPSESVTAADREVLSTLSTPPPHLTRHALHLSPAAATSFMSVSQTPPVPASPAGPSIPPCPWPSDHRMLTAQFNFAGTLITVATLNLQAFALWMPAARDADASPSPLALVAAPPKSPSSSSSASHAAAGASPAILRAPAPPSLVLSPPMPFSQSLAQTRLASYYSAVCSQPGLTILCTQEVEPHIWPRVCQRLNRHFDLGNQRYQISSLTPSLHGLGTWVGNPLALTDDDLLVSPYTPEEASRRSLITVAALPSGDKLGIANVHLRMLERSDYEALCSQVHACARSTGVRTWFFIGDFNIPSPAHRATLDRLCQSLQAALGTGDGSLTVESIVLDSEYTQADKDGQNYLDYILYTNDLDLVSGSARIIGNPEALLAWQGRSTAPPARAATPGTPTTPRGRPASPAAGLPARLKAILDQPDWRTEIQMFLEPEYINKIIDKPNQQRPLHYAIRYFRPDAINLFIANKVAWDDSYLTYAASVLDRLGRTANGIRASQPAGWEKKVAEFEAQTAILTDEIIPMLEAYQASLLASAAPVLAASPEAHAALLQPEPIPAHADLAATAILPRPVPTHAAASRPATPEEKPAETTGQPTPPRLGTSGRSAFVPTSPEKVPSAHAPSPDRPPAAPRPKITGHQGLGGATRSRLFAPQPQSQEPPAE